MKQNEFGAFVLSETKNGERIVSCGGRISTKQGSAIEIYKKSTDKEKNINLISKVVSSGHTTVLEHHYFNIAFNNVSVFVEQFLIEFRLASFTIKSGRYVNFEKAGFNLSNEFLAEQKEVISKHYKKMFNVYNEFIKAGVPIEDARFVLPYGIKTNIYMSVNARELVHIICTMIYGYGKDFEEIYNLGQMLKTEMDKRYPNLIESNSKFYKKIGDFENEKCCDNLGISADNFSKDKIEFVSQKVQIYDEMYENLSKKQQNLTKFLNFKENDLNNEKIKSRILEHINFTFEISNFSVISLKHYTRHRIQSLLTKGLLNMSFENKFIIPETISKDENLKNLFIDSIKENREICLQLFKENVNPFLYVYLMPHATATDFISTMNARELLHFSNLRACNRAQWEIRNLAIEMIKQLRNIDPILFKNFGPSCVANGFCPEGRLTCGKIKDVREKFEKLQN